MQEWTKAGLALLGLAGCSDDSQLDVGRQFVVARNCAACHQSANRADGLLSGQSTPLSGTMSWGSNLTPDPTTGLGDWADIEVVRALRAGVDSADLPLCTSMPRYDGSDSHYAEMGDVEAEAIVAYLRSLPPVLRADGGIPSSICAPFRPGLQDMGVSVSPDLSAPQPIETGDGGTA